MVILMNCVAQIESGLDYAGKGDGGKAVGAWQMHISAWSTANQWRSAHGMEVIKRSDWRVPENQKAMAFAYLSWCREQLVKAGIVEPSPQQIYMAFAYGFSAYKKCDLDLEKCPVGKQYDAKRVQNIFDELVNAK